MLPAKTLACGWDLEAERATAVAIARLPARPQDGLAMLLAKTLVWWRHIFCTVAFSTTCVAMTSTDVAGPDGTTVDFTKGNTTEARASTSLSLHLCSLTRQRNQ